MLNRVEVQPLSAQVERVVQAMELAGSPVAKETRDALKSALYENDPTVATAKIQQILDPLCLVGVSINPEGRVKGHFGQASKTLQQHGWRTFLVKVVNQAGVTAPLRCTSPNAGPLHESKNDAEPPQTITQRDVMQRWLDVNIVHDPPLNERLSGLELEYCVIELYSRDNGPRECKLAFDVGQGTQDLGFRNEVNILFDCQRCAHVKLNVLDDDGTPTTGQFTFRDAESRICPARSRRLRLISFSRTRSIGTMARKSCFRPASTTSPIRAVPNIGYSSATSKCLQAETYTEKFQLERWINLAKLGWFSGDHHVHAAGCAHYSSPTQGVEPADMMRHITGEDLGVGCVLTWGPCWYHQKQFFDGRVHPLSTPRNVMRYDVEVSGFPSSHAGHVVLLRLKEDDYPGTKRIDEWPSWDLPILKWAKAQGAVVGFAHSGNGLAVQDNKLPSYELPAFDGIGANEFIVDVTHDACDFISAVDTSIAWELSIWYHTLNCGFTTRISGETDFPCLTGERVGHGRVYVKVLPNEPLDFDRWVDGVRDGRSYCCDGRTHLVDFEINGFALGEPGEGKRASVLAAKAGDKLTIKCKAAGFLQQQPTPENILTRSLTDQPYWSVERARLKGTRQIPVELIVNGRAVDKKIIEADGRMADVEFQYVPERSSWIALRVFPAAHTNPIFVELDGRPIRASKRSAQWCLNAVDRCWKSKSKKIRDAEKQAARDAYDHAKAVYQQILAVSHDDIL